MADEPTAPCKRCGKPRPRVRGRSFCDGCTGTGKRHRLDAVPRVQRELDRTELLRLHEQGVPLSQDETAAALGISRTYVCMLERSGLAKVRAALGVEVTS